MGNEEAREELSRNRGLLTSHLIATKMTVYREYLPVNFHNLEFYETHPQRPTAYKTMLNILMLHFGSSFPYIWSHLKPHKK